ncbi:MAG: hypothetical protein IZT58_12210 [Actinobacteria bacterium]|nr:hypothetical protein [Actinomycetota bacterium]
MEQSLTQRTYTTVLQHLVDHGWAPHYTDLAVEFGISTEEARVAVNAAAEVGVGCWMSPGTDQVGSWAPLNSTPTHYRVSIDGESKWFGQCGLEVNAIRWLFPGKEVVVDALDLATAEPIRVRYRDEEILEVSPDSTVGHINHPMWRWGEYPTPDN